MKRRTIFFLIGIFVCSIQHIRTQEHFLVLSNPAREIPDELTRRIFLEILCDDAAVDDFQSVLSNARIAVKLFKNKAIHALIIDLLYTLYSKEGITKLILACELASEPLIFAYIEQYPTFIPELNAEALSTTPLISLTLCNAPIPTRFLISKGVLVNLENGDGKDALIYAASDDNVPFMKLLLRHRAQATAQALHEALLYESTEAVTFLVTQGLVNIESTFFDVSPLITAIRRRSEHMVALLLQLGANPNIECNGMSPLLASLLCCKPESLEPDELESQLEVSNNIVKLLASHPLIIKKTEKGSLLPYAPSDSLKELLLNAGFN
jgi:hypothetical protein